MNTENAESSRGSGIQIGFSGLLALLLIGLKLLGKIDLSWFWVLAPLWVPFALLLLLLILAALTVSFIGGRYE